jgi:D-beta-D-heptose 7-phosphate kinase/D-beta-D-heptose 1-phosphate adenosyltransferase
VKLGRPEDKGAQLRMFNFEPALKLMSEQTVLCIGDLMLDEFVYGEVSRVSPEAPSLVIAAQRTESMVGAAGNVARNIASLGARCELVSVVGNDDAGRWLTKALQQEARITPRLVVDASRPTTRKVRFVSEHHSTHLLRADWEVTEAIAQAIEKGVLEAVSDALPRADAVVLSDYAKGLLTPHVLHAVIERARKLGKPVIVDPKQADVLVYRGATVITPNRKELADATRRSAVTHVEIARAADELANAVGSEAVLVTMGELGMMLCRPRAAPIHVPAHPVRVRDVSGAGDTVVAAFSTLMAAGVDFDIAVPMANAAASIVVGKRGIATVSAAELRSRILPAAARSAEEKIVFDWLILDERLAEWRRQGLRIGFTNGCFDLLHPGHVKLLAQARAACDRLIVGLNSDTSVRRLKGEGRPMQDVHARAEVLAAVEAVDLVVVFEDDTPLDLISRVRPKVLIKGGDYRRDQVVGHDIVERDGGEVVLVDLVPGFSTSRIVAKSREPQAT